MVVVSAFGRSPVTVTRRHTRHTPTAASCVGAIARLRSTSRHDRAERISGPTSLARRLRSSFAFPFFFFGYGLERHVPPLFLPSPPLRFHKLEPHAAETSGTEPGWIPLECWFRSLEICMCCWFLPVVLTGSDASGSSCRQHNSEGAFRRNTAVRTGN